MQKSMFFNKNLLKHNINCNEERVSSKGSFWLGKTSNIRIFSTGRSFTHFLKLAIFEIF